MKVSRNVLPVVSWIIVASVTMLPYSRAFVASILPMRPKTQLYETGNVEQIEFKIYPDGRVEETVRGIKGGNCQKVTERINKALGTTITSQPTEEMYEQELVVEQTLTESVGDGSSAAEWEGKSSW